MTRILLALTLLTAVGCRSTPPILPADADLSGTWQVTRDGDPTATRTYAVCPDVPRWFRATSPDSRGVNELVLWEARPRHLVWHFGDGVKLTFAVTRFAPGRIELGGADGFRYHAVRARPSP